ncbi:MAG: hypothetical protein ABIQ39_05585, partial [Ilumatobacteraceae bacterium]
PSVFGDYAIVAGGYNYPYLDPARFDRSIDAMVDELVRVGTKHVFWVTLREVKPQYVSASAWQGVQPYYWYFPTVNQHLREALNRHPQLSLIDWASIADQPGLTYDAIHLNPNGARQYSALASDIVQTASHRLPAFTVTEIQVTGRGGVDADATAVALNLTAVNPRGPGYFTAYPCGRPRPVVSNLNFLPGQIVAASAIVPVGDDGKVCVFQYGDSNMVVDVTGSFGPSSGFVPVLPARAVDTRETPSRIGALPTVVHVGAIDGVPADRSSVVINLTTIGGANAGILNVYPCDGPPPSFPTRTILPGEIQNLLLVSAVDINGDVCVTSSQPTDAILDVFGAFASDAEVHPMLPVRVIDTGGIAAASTVSTAQIGGRPDTSPAPTGAVVSVNATNAQESGFVTVYPCADGRPFTSMMNTTPNHSQGNSTIAKVDPSGQLCVYQLFAGHITVDVTGWTGDAFRAITPYRLLDTRELSPTA